METLGRLIAQSLDGQDVELTAYDGRVGIIVNTDSPCGVPALVRDAPRRRGAYD